MKASWINGGSPGDTKINGDKVFAIRMAFLLIYIFVYFLFFFSRSKENSIFWSTLVITSLSLWFGPISAIQSGGSQTFYDPRTIFNLGIFYYCIKGISLAWGEIPIFLKNIYYPNIVHDYPIVAVYVLLGIMAWNFSYSLSRNRFVNRSSSVFKTNLSINGEYYLYPGIIFLSAIGLSCFFLLIQSVGQGFFVFLTHPEARGYLTVQNAGAGFSYGFFVLYGIYMLPIASIIWLAMFAFKKQKPTFFWWLHTAVGLFILLLVSPRTSLIGYVITLFIIYHLLIHKVSVFVIGSAGLIIFLYASITRLLREIMGTMSHPDLSAGINELFKIVNVDTVVNQFLGGTNLADIRIFILIQNFYGHSLPLKYGETFSRIITQLVPRNLWAGKPYDLGVEIGHLYDPFTLSGSPPGLFAEMYMNFHFVGVLLGAALAGFLLSLIYHSWVVSKPSIIFFIMYAILAPLIFILPSATTANFIINMGINAAGVLIAFAVSPFFTHQIRELSIRQHR
jgi:hypothetical protein